VAVVSSSIAGLTNPYPFFVLFASFVVGFGIGFVG